MFPTFLLFLDHIFFSLQFLPFFSFSVVDQVLSELANSTCLSGPSPPFGHHTSWGHANPKTALHSPYPLFPVAFLPSHLVQLLSCRHLLYLCRWGTWCLSPSALGSSWGYLCHCHLVYVEAPCPAPQGQQAYKNGGYSTSTQHRDFTNNFQAHRVRYEAIWAEGDKCPIEENYKVL